MLVKSFIYSSLVDRGLAMRDLLTNQFQPVRKRLMVGQVRVLRMVRTARRDW